MLWSRPLANCSCPGDGSRATAVSIGTGSVKSKGVPATGCISPVVMSVLSNGVYSVAFTYRILSTTVFSGRSEEHTSELQSLMRISYAVFCLKKKKKHAKTKKNAIKI